MRPRDLAIIMIVTCVEGWIGFLGLLLSWFFVMHGSSLMAVWVASVPAVACWAMYQAIEGYGRMREILAEPD